MQIVEREVRGQKTVFVTLTAKFTSPFLLHPTINTTETQPKQQKGKKGEVKKGEVTVPEPVPAVVPEPESLPQPEPTPKPEPINPELKKPTR